MQWVMNRLRIGKQGHIRGNEEKLSIGGVGGLVTMMTSYFT